MLHSLKTERKFFEATWAGKKTFEIRVNDRGFKVGDDVILTEIDGEGMEETGRMIGFRIAFLTDFAQKKDYVVFSGEIQWIEDGT